MIRLHVIAEGQTEEAFVHLVLAPHLAERNVFADVHCVTTRRRHGKVWRGGLRRYAQVKKDIDLWCANDRRPDARFTTLLDLYGLPNDFPGRKESRDCSDPYEKVEIVEQALSEDVKDRRFLPYVQLHEFEALLLAEPRKLEDEFMEQAEGIGRLEDLVSGFESPEQIDEGVETAPSKRIIREIPEYEGRKATAGPRVAGKIGTAVLREKCPHFGGWLETLETLDTMSPR